MNARLRAILAKKQQEVENLLAAGAPPGPPPGRRRSLRGALSTPGKINLIAEIKFASPAAGTIRPLQDPVAIGRCYQRAGAAAISLLTDKKFFNGDLEVLPRLKQAVNLPVLRKDFIIHPCQIEESAILGADAVLLIARILPGSLLSSLLGACKEFGLESLVEVHDRQELDRALEAGAWIIGINNRDLDTFAVNRNTVRELAPLVPAGVMVVAESGIRGPDDVQALKRLGVDAVLVGTAIMASPDPEAMVRALAAAGEVGP